MVDFTSPPSVISHVTLMLLVAMVPDNIVFFHLRKDPTMSLYPPLYQMPKLNNSEYAYHTQLCDLEQL
jgi:hypothetical protein